MRIVSGHLRGRRLDAPPGHAVRPTSERVRAALFDVLTHRFQRDGRFALAGIGVLDAFAGTGALGFEALSRGAAQAVFLDRDPALVRALDRRAAEWGVADVVRARRADATRPPPCPADMAPCGLVFLDPPYGQGLAGPTLAALDAAGWLAPKVLCVVETGRDEAFDGPAGFEEHDTRIHGRARLRFLGRAGQNGEIVA
ncbi:16S rRNA (guanine(966)-N(2))-methyltransferase RsmD [Roseospira marina]|uniref:16S rRNA (Guanine(966)-N(2))-methyltransferase RsmD n=1 Tax=Roseospira marina TaxID=140057 RepID=A0A5M6IEA9_9PROT|nr:16S rRNA (guanine(966)-N(2))-methyltransferase RsmD [Roseospira marina]KAA5606307.1 16S rRNA (guanine(966)-N(2))-methyltransferase RsmD [Roseospira marina]MBB4314468.1 16S rRNA (guanine966-N2)-methyltransferase [Roseospira marina]MBB5087628.1 16S rRNA (guanine966-N2)-methyltransferase [Roseospira marina]